MASQEDVEILTTIHKKPKWFFYPTWIILTCLCMPIAFFFDFAILRLIISVVGDYIYVDGVRHITEDYLFMYIFVPLVGLLTGLLQYGLLRRYLPHMDWWVVATTGGWLAGMFVSLIFRWLSIQRYASLERDLAFMVMGLSIGMGQWFLLRRRLSRAGWWIGAHVVGWGLLSLISGDSLGQFGLLALGLLPACATAAMLALLMNQAQPTEPQGV